MSMNINVLLGGGGGGNGRQAKLSAKGTSSHARQVIQQTNNFNGAQALRKVGSASKGLMSGSASKLLSSVPVLAAVFAALHVVDRGINLGANIYQALSGEDMFASNVKAYSKTFASAGLNLFIGGIKNEIFTKPRLIRENNMREYGRELYTNIGYNEKNKLT